MIQNLDLGVKCSRGEFPFPAKRRKSCQQGCHEISCVKILRCIFYRAFELGVALYPGMATVDGHKGDHVLLAPPYTVSEEEIKEITKVMRKAYDIEATLFDDGLPSTETNEATTKMATT